MASELAETEDIDDTAAVGNLLQNFGVVVHSVEGTLDIPTGSAATDVVVLLETANASVQVLVTFGAGGIEDTFEVDYFRHAAAASILRIEVEFRSVVNIEGILAVVGPLGAALVATSFLSVITFLILSK